MSTNEVQGRRPMPARAVRQTAAAQQSVVRVEIASWNTAVSLDRDRRPPSTRRSHATAHRSAVVSDRPAPPNRDSDAVVEDLVDQC